MKKNGSKEIKNGSYTQGKKSSNTHLFLGYLKPYAHLNIITRDLYYYHKNLFHPVLISSHLGMVPETGSNVSWVLLNINSYLALLCVWMNFGQNNYLLVYTGIHLGWVCKSGSKTDPKDGSKLISTCHFTEVIQENTLLLI